MRGESTREAGSPGMARKRMNISVVIMNKVIRISTILRARYFVIAITIHPK
jgi:hypothetical protein